MLQLKVAQQTFNRDTDLFSKSAKGSWGYAFRPARGNFIQVCALHSNKYCDSRAERWTQHKSNNNRIYCIQSGLKDYSLLTDYSHVWMHTCTHTRVNRETKECSGWCVCMSLYTSECILKAQLCECFKKHFNTKWSHTFKVPLQYYRLVQRAQCGGEQRSKQSPSNETEDRPSPRLMCGVACGGLCVAEHAY